MLPCFSQLRRKKEATSRQGKERGPLDLNFERSKKTLRTRLVVDLFVVAVDDQGYVAVAQEEQYAQGGCDKARLGDLRPELDEGT
jgi:hypothetical protein